MKNMHTHYHIFHIETLSPQELVNAVVCWSHHYNNYDHQFLHSEISCWSQHMDIRTWLLHDCVWLCL